jgi:hypothetical protein
LLAKLHVLVGEKDRSVFLVTSSAIGLGPGRLVSVVCARANGDAAAGVTQFKCQLRADGPPGSGSTGYQTFNVGSSNLAGGVAAAERQEDFLAVTPKMVRIEVARAAATSTPSPAARCPDPPVQLASTS